ncbi:MAG TPA: cysteine--tRNA ligase [Gammaproteobacteria bacterium]|nr:cysteine--tRNA ligase [Gammaproteobacteria bacterium]
MLQIHNSLTRAKAPFEPIDPANVRLYVCGMTVYDLCHLGHARVMVVFDVVCRYLRRLYGAGHVTYVRNITDIDDKIINRARENHEDYARLTHRFIDAMHEDAAALGVLPPDEEPRATGHIEAMVAMIGTLVDKGYAYVAADGDVYYDVSRFEAYGRLSGKRLEDLRAGARVEVDEDKRDPLDFVLWKAAKPGEPHWDSPWGPGRPGWHIECSAMSVGCLGDHFDIHGGGMDLMFPHHENEIAQSEAATDHTFVSVWMHNGFVRVDEEKMSKSLGNFFTVRELLARYKPEVLRFFIINSHYRSPLNYTDGNVDEARAKLDRLYTALRGVEPSGTVDDSGDYARRFFAAMDDDFNTPDALAVLFELARELNRAKEAGDDSRAAELAGQLRGLGQVLGLLQTDPEMYLRGSPTVINAGVGRWRWTGRPATIGASPAITDEQIDELIANREQARRDKNWAEADRIRDELKAQGIVLEDSAKGTTWRRE